MVTINIRELSHNLSKYLKEVKAGERIIIKERNKAIAELIPHNENVVPAVWKQKIKKVKIKGESMSETITKMREEDYR